jgi:hypothetical protein
VSASADLGARIRRAISGLDAYRLAVSINERTGCGMRRARKRARSIKSLGRPALSLEQIRQLMNQPGFRHDSTCLAPLVPCRCSGKGVQK